MVRQKTREAFTAATSYRQKLAAQDKSTSTSLEVRFLFPVFLQCTLYIFYNAHSNLLQCTLYIFCNAHSISSLMHPLQCTPQRTI